MSLLTKAGPDEMFQSASSLIRERNSGHKDTNLCIRKSFISFYRHNNCEPKRDILYKC